MILAAVPHGFWFHRAKKGSLWLGVKVVACSRVLFGLKIVNCSEKDTFGSLISQFSERRVEEVNTKDSTQQHLIFCYWPPDLCSGQASWTVETIVWTMQWLCKAGCYSSVSANFKNWCHFGLECHLLYRNS